MKSLSPTFSPSLETVLPDAPLEAGKFLVEECVALERSGSRRMDARLLAYDANVFDYLGNLDCEFYVTVAPMKCKRVPKRENNEGMWKLRAYPRMFETAKLNQKDLGKVLKNVDQAEEDLLYGDECGEDYMKRYMSETRLRAKLQCLAGKLKPLL